MRRRESVSLRNGEILAADKTAKKPAEKGSTESYPAVVIIAVVVFDIMDHANKCVMLGRVVATKRR